MDKNQKLALKLFRAKGYRYMEKLPSDIRVSSLIGDGDSDEYSCVDICFDTDPQGVIFFTVSVDSDWYLCEDFKLREDAEMANPFYKDGRKVYTHIINRAMECVALALQGKFSKIKV